MSDKILLAGNTSRGFINYFREFIGDSYGIYIKGGSGVGKSTFMREVESRAKVEGYTVRHVPCSSDLESLDMVRVFGLNVSVLDATSPHLFEPIAYGLDGEIFDLGKYLDGSKLVGSASIIRESMWAKSQSYKCLYNELWIARLALDNIAHLYKDKIKETEYNALVRAVLEEAREERSCYSYNAFCDYIDSTGYHDIRGEYVEGREAVVLQCRCADISEDVLSVIAETLEREGVRHIRYHSILHPEALTAIATRDKLYSAKMIEDARIIELDRVIDNVGLSTFISEIIKERACVSQAIERASKFFRRSREAHGRIEEAYLKAMDFDRLEEDKAMFIDKLFS